MINHPTVPWYRALVCVFLFYVNPVLGQSVDHTDSLRQLPEVAVQAYLSQQPLLQAPASIGVVNAEQLGRQTGQSLLPALNLVPGVRMEERSPGSYRLSIRGSLLRAPFGVRNVKVYLDEFPLTDAGGNTYINLIDAKVIERVEILKGPDGSLFGANSGGVLLMYLAGRKGNDHEIRAGLDAGSFGLFHENISIKNTFGKSQFSFNQAWQRSDGYRENSALQRHFLQAAGRRSYGKNNSVKLLLLYSDLNYKTPGGLTQAQYDADPMQARPAAGPNPGALEQQAGIYNKTIFGGITNELYFSKHLRWVASVFGSYTDFKNPFITNYETRNEKNLGVRSYVELLGGKENTNVNWKWNIGLEGQKGWQEIANYENNGGDAGAQLAQNDLDINQIFYFTRLAATIGQRLHTEIAISLNGYEYAYVGWASEGARTFADQWMPRFAASYLFSPDFALRATLSRGYSPPTLAEIRSSNNMVNTTIQPESGWNREAGFRLSAWKGRLQMDASVFRYDLTNAIVRRLDPAGAEYFVNAGGTKQTGVESIVTAWLMAPKSTGVIRGIQATGSYTYSRFLFENYQDATADYSGNSLTGVPQTVMMWSIALRLPQNIDLFAASNTTARLPLNDANTVYAGKYHLLQAKVKWSGIRVKRAGIEVFAGADNILNEKYSLGNDINAFGGRYFNAAPPLNFYGGMQVNLR